MKSSISILVLLVLFTFNRSDRKYLSPKCQYSVYVIKTDFDDIDGFSDKEFWSDASIHLDTLIIVGENINSSIQSKLNSLKKIDWYPNNPELDFIRSSAFVSNCENKQDTIYSDRQIKYFKKETDIYIDTTGKLNLYFYNLLVDE